MERITEMASTYRHLEKMSVNELLVNMNREDRTVPNAVEKAIPQIEKLVQAIVQKMQNGGRLFYIGAGTSGRLGVLDASECPPTYGVPKDLIIGIIAGGDTALRNSVEAAEDNHQQAWNDLKAFDVNVPDIVVGIAASGTTPYVIEGLKKCRSESIATACITCNPQSLLAEVSDFPVEIVTGPEFVTGSTRMKAGTAQKLALNMISTSVMIQMGRVLDNIMVDMQLSNHKLIDRGIKMIMKQLNVSYSEANNLLQKHGNVRNVLNNHVQSTGVNA
jgi:N-acetylmuramic acid 6-phosphate etherase